jgi:hypothetical protein
MDLVIQSTVHKKFRHFIQEACINTHRRYLSPPVERVITVEADTHREFASKMLQLVSGGQVSPQFVLTRDNVLLTAPFEARPMSNKQSMWHRRRGVDTEVMVNTIRMLSEMESAGIYDCEVPAPMLMDAQKLMQVLMGASGEAFMLRTLYLNAIGVPLDRVDDPSIQSWGYGMSPKAPVVAIEDTCLKHRECVVWLRKAANHALVPA